MQFYIFNVANTYFNRIALKIYKRSSKNKFDGSIIL